MDPATMIGIGVALGSILTMILLEGASPMSILLPAPMILVFGATFAVTLAGGTLKDTLGALKALPSAFVSKPKNAAASIDTIVGLADRARREGLLALEDAARDIDDEFLKGGLRSAIDGTDPEDLRAILEDRIHSKRVSDKLAYKFFHDMGGYAPTIGIVGTVVSLVHVLENLANPDELGHLIAAAFVATLWGILSANVMWLPIGNRLRRLSELECSQMELVVEGLLSVQAGANPRLVGERLRSLLPLSEQTAGKEAA
ncbi:motility protein A [Sanguibacter antarcticus]|uniref:Chemotaxis protein MotA n=1 Tax=Sanguibacter antarcticus TaxID=372484 RepID=A0A2A9E0Y7_9MICO|nr:MotA/TolQ/ExbB proton channel family protein [Sanguibacter antarcticus]PFG32241.1 chemotaxis protein MotA [Sanguibacter antarcticus]